MLGGVMLFALLGVPQCASRSFDRGGDHSFRTAAYQVAPRTGGLIVASSHNGTLWHDALADDISNLYRVDAEWRIETNGLWINFLERQYVAFKADTWLEERTPLPDLDPAVLRAALVDFVARDPVSATDWLSGMVSAAELTQLLKGDVRRVVWPNVALLMLQVTMVFGGLLLIWRGLRELRVWHESAHLRCQSCGYSTEGLEVAERCPECGGMWSPRKVESRWPRPGMFPPLRSAATVTLILGVAAISSIYLVQRLGDRYPIYSHRRGGFSGLYAFVSPDGIDLQPSTTRNPMPDPTTDVYCVQTDWARSSRGLWLPYVESVDWSISADPISIANYQPPPMDNAALHEAVRGYVLELPGIADRVFTGEVVPTHILLENLGRKTERFLSVPIAMMCGQLLLLCLGIVLVTRGLLGYRHWYMTSHQQCVLCSCPTPGLSEADRCPHCKELWSVRDYQIGSATSV